MRVLLTSFLVLFGVVELFQWAEGLSLPMPIFVLGGVFLAIASNYHKLKILPIHLDSKKSDTLQKVVPPGPTNPVQIKGKSPTTPSVSFEIRKPFKPGD